MRNSVPRGSTVWSYQEKKQGKATQKRPTRYPSESGSRAYSLSEGRGKKNGGRKKLNGGLP